MIVLYCLGFLAASAIFNGFAVNVTKFTSATNRVVVDQTRVVLIWVFFLTYAGVGHESFSMAKLGGFGAILLGVAFFNRIFHFDMCLGKESDEKPSTE